jgi:hypothetical protein
MDPMKLKPRWFDPDGPVALAAILVFGVLFVVGLVLAFTSS